MQLNILNYLQAGDSSSKVYAHGTDTWYVSICIITIRMPCFIEKKLSFWKKQNYLHYYQVLVWCQ